MPNSTSSTRSRLRVLIVEDDEEDYQLTRDMLTQAGVGRYSSHWVATYEAGIEEMRANTYDVCLIDYHLGARTGSEFMRECTAAGMNSAMILLTGRSALEADLDAMEAGASDYLDKQHLSAHLLERSIRYALERKKTLSILKESKAFLRSTLDSLSTGIAILDSAGVILYTNHAWNSVGEPTASGPCQTGANYLDICAMAGRDDMPAAAEIARGIRCVMSDAEGSFYLEYPCGGEKDRLRWFALQVTRFASPNRDCVVLANENITERKAAVEQRAAADLMKILHAELETLVAQRTAELRREIVQRQEAETRLEASLQEKEVLLREIHHRVKNNLQVISSLLNLHAMTTRNSEVRTVLVDSQNRVVSMALIHEQLYGSTDFSRIDMPQYFRQMLQHIFSSFGSTALNVTARVVASERIMLTLEKAIPCGLIVNELISNALKHAFTGRGGELRVSLSRQDGAVSVQVTDNGVGLPEGFDASVHRSLGLRIVSTLTRQLRGRFSAAGLPRGAAFAVEFAEE